MSTRLVPREWPLAVCPGYVLDHLSAMRVHSVDSCLTPFTPLAIDSPSWTLLRKFDQSYFGCLANSRIWSVRIGCATSCIDRGRPFLFHWRLMRSPSVRPTHNRDTFLAAHKPNFRMNLVGSPESMVAISWNTWSGTTQAYSGGTSRDTRMDRSRFQSITTAGCGS